MKELRAVQGVGQVDWVFEYLHLLVFGMHELPGFWVHAVRVDGEVLVAVD